jgi:2-keto-3-deoxy-6-phosphogluconate aldolase
VMPRLRMLVTGGLRVTADSLLPWLDAGALAVGLGGDLGRVATHGAGEVERRARAAAAIAARTGHDPGESASA